MSLNEILTCVRENIPTIAVVFNNRQWGAEKKNQVWMHMYIFGISSVFDSSASEWRWRTERKQEETWTLSYNPSGYLPNQEKNQYWTVYTWGREALYAKVKEGSYQEISDLLEEGRILAVNKYAAAFLGELTITWKRSLTMVACLKWLWAVSKVKNIVGQKTG